LYVVESDERDALQSTLEAAGVATGIHYPLPLHLQPALRSLGYGREDLPHCESIAERLLSLPIFPELNRNQVVRIAAIAGTAAARGGTYEKANIHTLARGAGARR
jgi:dTDP-4-amino-4,6-dideoxygalactose transaminase